MESMTISLPNVAAIVVFSVSWAGSIAGVYFHLRGRVDALQDRLAAQAARLDTGTERFNLLEGRLIDHGSRIIVVETLLGSMNDKLDSILLQVKRS